MYTLINKLLTRKDCYDEHSWKNNPLEQFALMRTKSILQELSTLNLLPHNMKGEPLASWLLNDSPLNESEKLTIQHFLFEIDYY